MAAGQTKFDIVSRALVLLGEKPISSFTEGTSGDIADKLYDITVDAFLTETRWRFAVKKKISLSKLATAPLNEWTNAFQMPNDLLLMIRTYPKTSYEIFEDQIFTNVSTLDIDYNFRPTEAQFPAWFIVALAAELSDVFAIPITNNRSLKDDMARDAIKALIKARQKNAGSRPPVAIQHRPLVDVRRGRTSRYG